MSEYETLCRRSAEAARATLLGRYHLWAMNVYSPQNRPLLSWWQWIGGAALTVFFQ